jgi:hypothetical protein
LTGKRVLQFGGRSGDAVNDEHEVERVRGCRLAVVQLPDDRGAIALVALRQLRRQRVGRLEEAGAECDAVQLDRRSENADRAAGVEERGDVLHHLGPCGLLAAEPHRELLPLLGLRRGDKGEQLVRE